MSGPANILEVWGLCPYCLSIKAISSYACVHFTDATGTTHIKYADNTTYPNQLSAWVYKYIDNVEIDPETLDFEVNGYHNAFIPVAVINGSPVCPLHLWVLVK
jgi:hypothetical protein